MKTLLKATAFALITCSALTVNAQQKRAIYPTLDSREPIILISEENPQQKTIVNIFEVTEIPSFHEPNAPRFLLMDQKGKFAMGIGGYARTVVSYDFDGISNNVDFIPADIPSKNSNISKEQFRFDATTTMLFLKMIGRTETLGDIIFYTGGNFRGNNNTFKLRNAYVSFLGFTFGFDTGMFMDGAVFPPTIDFQGPNGMTFYRTTQARFETDIAKGLKVGIGIEAPSVSATYLNNDVSSTQKVPNIPAYIQYSWNSASHIKIAGIYRSMSYRNDADDKFNSINGWGVQGSTTFSLGNFQIYGQYTYGKGIACFFNDLGTMNLDIVPNYKNNKMQALPMSGWLAGIQYNFSKKIFASSTFSGNYLYSCNNYSKFNQDNYKNGKYLVANVFWNVSSDFQVGAEYLHGWRKVFDGTENGANRINLCTKLNF